MPLSLDEKKQVVARGSRRSRRAPLVGGRPPKYRGLDVAAMTEFRRQARAAGVYVRVVPNNLAKRAVESTDFEVHARRAERAAGAGVLARGPGVGGPGGPRLPAGQPEAEGPAGGVRAAKLVDPAEIDSLANLPTWEEAIARLMATLKAPVTRLVRTLAEPHAKLVRAVDAVRKQKEEAAGGPEGS